jgi:hypothetical protein
MARRIVHQLVDDLDGSVLEIGEGDTVTFSLDGVAYEIDLTDSNASTFRELFAPYIDAARRVSTTRGTSGGASGGARKRRRTGQQDYSAVRQWAKDNGYQISERGRVPASVLDAYEAAQ